MAYSPNTTALAVALQSVAGTFTAPTQPDDLMPVSQCRFTIDGVTIANDEYTGSPVKNSDQITGKRVSLSFNAKLRAPGGASPPAANAFLLGRLLQACKMTELRSSTAMVASEALGVGSDAQNAKLGTTAVATADLYNALPLLLAGVGTTYKDHLTLIRDYAADKTATLVEDLGAAPTGNYSIPAYLAYARSVDSTDPQPLSMSLWLGGDRYDLRDCNVTQAQLVLPTSTKQQGAFPELQVTFDATIDDHVEEAAPSVTPLGAVPFFKDGTCQLAYKQVGTQTVTIDLGIQSDNPPNPNQVDGVDPAQLVSSTAKVTMTRQKYKKTTLDTLSLADAQAYHAFYAAYGNGSAGGMIQVAALNGRFNYQSPDTGGNFVNETGDLMVDADDRGIVIAFAY